MIKSFYRSIVRYLRTKLSRIQLIMLIAILTGFISGMLAVLDKDKKFAGFISKTKLFNKYREILASQGDLYE